MEAHKYVKFAQQKNIFKRLIYQQFEEETRAQLRRNLEITF